MTTEIFDIKAKGEKKVHYHDGVPCHHDHGTVFKPVINPNRNVGRNDSCPCGSGKKFKKCCISL